MGRRGPRPMASATKETLGTFAANPQRRNHEEPQVIHDRPAASEIVQSNERALAKWNHACDLLETMKILSTADHDMLEQYCLIYARLIECEMDMASEDVLLVGAKGNMVRNPRLVVIAKLQDQQLKLLREMGLTPSARSALKASPEAFSDPFDKWQKRLESLN